MRKLFSLFRSGVRGIIGLVLFCLASIPWFLHGQADIPPSPKEQCEVTVFADYNRVSLLLKNKTSEIEDSGGSSVDAQIRERRLEEEYCRKIAICDFIGDNPNRNPMVFSTDFYDCLRDEAKEKNQ